MPASMASSGLWDAPVVRSPRLELWGLIEMWISDPDGVRVALIEAPGDHPLRRDPRIAND
jgi:hypothetical protein